MYVIDTQGLPSAIVQAAMNDPYDAGECDISVTRLIQPPRLVRLVKLFGDQLQVEAADLVRTMLGQAVHALLERAEPVAAAAEQRLYCDCLGWRVGGKWDRLELDRPEGVVLQDYKCTSAWSLVGGSRSTEWAEQLNLLAHLYRANGLDNVLGPLVGLEIVAILTDWRPSEAKRIPGYPGSRIVVQPQVMLEPSIAYAFMEGRVAMHQAAEHELPRCTPEDRWWNEKQRRFIRCEEYCPARSVCSQRFDTN